MPPCVEFPWLYNSRHQHHCSGGSSSAGGGGVDGVSGRDVVTPPQQPDVEQDPSLSTAMMGGSEGEAPDSPSQATSDPKGDDNAGECSSSTNNSLVGSNPGFHSNIYRNSALL